MGQKSVAHASVSKWPYEPAAKLVSESLRPPDPPATSTQQVVKNESCLSKFLKDMDLLTSREAPSSK